MKKIVSIIIIIIASYFILNILSFKNLTIPKISKNLESQKANNNFEIKDQLTTMPIIKAPKGEPIKVEIKNPSNDSNPYSKIKESITFEMYNGWAIAQKDILLGKVLDNFSGKTGETISKSSGLWPSNVIPFHIDEKLINPSRIYEAIEYFQKNTPIRLTPLIEEDENAIVFVPDADRCASYVGKIGGFQPILIGPKCQKQEIIHEIMHALGFIHEQSRADRDQFIKINWSNIEEVYWPQFAIFPEELIHEYKGSVFNFDHQSVMLYSKNAFSKNPNLFSIESKTSTPVMPVQNGLSSIDLERLHYLYNK